MGEESDMECDCNTSLNDINLSVKFAINYFVRCLKKERNRREWVLVCECVDVRVKGKEERTKRPKNSSPKQKHRTRFRMMDDADVEDRFSPRPHTGSLRGGHF